MGNKKLAHSSSFLPGLAAVAVLLICGSAKALPSPRGRPTTHTPSNKPSLALLVAGCTTPGLADVYLLSFSYSTAATGAADGSAAGALAAALLASVSSSRSNGTGAGTAPQLREVRVGFLASCLAIAPSDGHGQDQTLCSTHGAASLVASLLLYAAPATGGNQTAADPLDLIGIAERARAEVIFSGLW